MPNPIAGRLGGGGSAVLGIVVIGGLLGYIAGRLPYGSSAPATAAATENPPKEQLVKYIGPRLLLCEQPYLHQCDEFLRAHNYNYYALERNAVVSIGEKIDTQTSDILNGDRTIHWVHVAVPGSKIAGWVTTNFISEKTTAPVGR